MQKSREFQNNNFILDFRQLFSQYRLILFFFYAIFFILFILISIYIVSFLLHRSSLASHSF